MKNLIIDLDNTIFPVSAIGEKLFAPLFRLLASPEYQISGATIEKAKAQIMKIPFQKVALEFGFPADLTERALELLRNLTYNEPMSYFEDYPIIRELNCMKFLLTTGFKKLQESKIRSLGIQDDFTEIFVIDPDNSNMTKKDAMIHIMDKYKIQPENLVVVGDDPDSEIKAANELNLISYLIDGNDSLTGSAATYKGRNLAGLQDYLE
jgi:putative hydrolase of the HAD superfamily